MKKDQLLPSEKRLEKLKAENRSLKENISALKRERDELHKLVAERNRIFHAIPAGIALVQQGVILGKL